MTNIYPRQKDYLVVIRVDGKRVSKCFNYDKHGGQEMAYRHARRFVDTRRSGRRCSAVTKEALITENQACVRGFRYLYLRLNTKKGLVSRSVGQLCNTEVTSKATLKRLVENMRRTKRYKEQLAELVIIRNLYDSDPENFRLTEDITG